MQRKQRTMNANGQIQSQPSKCTMNKGKCVTDKSRIMCVKESREKKTPDRGRPRGKREREGEREIEDGARGQGKMKPVQIHEGRSL